MKQRPKALPKPTTHIIDWFHIAMKIQPLQRAADHIDRTNASRNGRAILTGDDIRSLNWKLWRGQTDQAIDRLEKIVANLTIQRSRADTPDKRLLDLAQPLLTYVRLNRNTIANYGARYGSGRRIASSLAESAVDSLVARRTVKKAIDALDSQRRASDVASSCSGSLRRLARAFDLANSNADAPLSLGMDVRANTAIAKSRMKPS
jgi:hypothetical protein